MLSSGSIIKAAREHRQLTQEQVAILAGAVQEEISRWENGQHSITSDRLLRLLDKLHFHIVLVDYQQPSLRATLAIQVISSETLPTQFRRRLEGMSQEELIQVIGWLWTSKKEQKAWNQSHEPKLS